MSIRDKSDPDDDGTAALAQSIAVNLRHFRTRQGLSLARLASLSGVSRAMLGQIELAQSVPTIATLWKIAKALEIPFSTLLSYGPGTRTAVLRLTQCKTLSSHGGGFTSRALFPFEGERRVEFYELRLAEKAEEAAEPHALGTTENIAVAQGAVEIIAGDRSYRLNQGDAVLFEADVPHIYRNVGAGEAVMFLVMIYVEPVIS